MNLRRKFLGLVLLITFILIPLTGRADGGAIFSVELEKSEQEINLPSQQAIILWDSFDKEEVLSLSTGIKAKEIGDMAWIIPVPSKTKPEVEKENPEIFNQIPYFFAKIERVSGSALPLIVFIFLILLLLFILFRKKRSRKELILGGILILLVMLFSSIVLVSLSGAGGGLKSKISPIEIIETKKVGIYDVVILKATDAKYMVNWLNKHGYKIGGKNVPILQDYCDQPNFYFVVNKINQEALDEKDLKEGMATPLRIKFQPQQPFYPLRLSSINGGETAIDVYVISSHPVRDKSGILSVKKTRNLRNTMETIYHSRDQKAAETVSDFYNQWIEVENMDYFSGDIGTWLHYEGDLKELQEDAYFKSDLVTCQNLSPKEEEKWPGFKINQDRCYKIFAESSDDGSLCEKIKNQELRDDCYKNVSRQDPKWCEKISDKWNRRECYEDFAQRTSNLSHCREEAPSFHGEDICFLTFARKDKDDSLCQEIAAQSLKDACYYSVAVQTSDASLCKSVTQNIRGNGYSRDCCYYQIARKTSNLSLCEKIEDQEKKRACQKGEYTSCYYNW